MLGEADEAAALRPADLWTVLHLTGKLEFLVDDLAAHKERVRERYTR